MLFPCGMNLQPMWGQELLDIANKSKIGAIKSLKVGDFQGVSLLTISRSLVLIDPDIPEAKKVRYWYDSKGKDTSMASVGFGLSPMSKNGARSMYSDHVSLSHITSNPSLEEDKEINFACYRMHFVSASSLSSSSHPLAFFSIRAYVSFIKPDQTMWYQAYKTCNKKVTKAIGSEDWREGCQKINDECNLKYIMVSRVSDASGEAYISPFNEHAEKIVSCSAKELDQLKS